MIGRTPQEALTTYTATLQRILSCVVHGRLVRESTDPFGVEPTVHTLALNANAPARMYGPTSLYLVVNETYSIVSSTGSGSGDWQIQTRGYAYALQTAEESEFVAFHWNPRSDTSPTRPHVHVGRRLLRQPIDLGSEQLDLPKVHIPTGRVALEDVIRMAITEFRVEPRREDWESVLDQN